MKEILAGLRKIKGKKEYRNAWQSVAFLPQIQVPTNCPQVERSSQKCSQGTNMCIFSCCEGEKAATCLWFPWEPSSWSSSRCNCGLLLSACWDFKVAFDGAVVCFILALKHLKMDISEDPEVECCVLDVLMKVFVLLCMLLWNRVRVRKLA